MDIVKITCQLTLWSFFFSAAISAQPPSSHHSLAKAKRLQEELQYLESSAQELEFSLPAPEQKAADLFDDTDSQTLSEADEGIENNLLEDEVSVGAAAAIQRRRPGPGLQEEIADDIDLNELESRLEEVHELSAPIRPYPGTSPKRRRSRDPLL